MTQVCLNPECDRRPRRGRFCGYACWEKYARTPLGPPPPCQKCGRAHDGTYYRRAFCSTQCYRASHVRSRPAPVSPTQPTAATERREGLGTVAGAESVDSKPFRPPTPAAPDPPPDHEPYKRLEEGERRRDKAGYVALRIDGRVITEHRWAMEQKLGRKLVKGESVHHKNGVRADNRPENLELWVGPIRSGIRATDFRCPHCGEAWHYDDLEAAAGVAP